MYILTCIVDLLWGVMQITSAKLYFGYGDLGSSLSLYRRAATDTRFQGSNEGEGPDRCPSTKTLGSPSANVTPRNAWLSQIGNRPWDLTRIVRFSNFSFESVAQARPKPFRLVGRIRHL